MINDPYLKPAYGLGNRLRRSIWFLAWAFLYWPTPRPMFVWRAFILRCFGARLAHPVFFYPQVSIWAPWLLKAAPMATVADGVELYNPGGVELRGHAIISQGAFICGGSHDFNSPNFPMISRPIVVEEYAWVCARAIVLPGTTIGRGAVLGAGAVTSKDLEPFGVYAGNPARRVGTRAFPVLPPVEKV